MRIDQQVLQIVAEVVGMPVREVDADTPLRDWSALRLINDETCMALNINIGSQMAAQCRSVGDYLGLVRNACS